MRPCAVHALRGNVDGRPRKDLERVVNLLDLGNQLLLTLNLRSADIASRTSKRKTRVQILEIESCKKTDERETAMSKRRQRIEPNAEKRSSRGLISIHTETKSHPPHLRPTNKKDAQWNYLRRRLGAEGQAAEIVLGLRLVAAQQFERLLPLLLGHANHARRHVLVDLGLESARVREKECVMVRVDEYACVGKIKVIEARYRERDGEVGVMRAQKKIKPALAS